MKTEYGQNFLLSVQANCGARGIVEIDGVLAELTKKAGKPLDECTDRELSRLQRDLGAFLTAYLDGEKRRPTLRRAPPGTGTSAGESSVNVE